MEVWKPIQGYENLYEISNNGKVRSLERVVKTKNKYDLYIHEKLLSYRVSKTTKRHPNKRYFVELWKNNKRKVEAVSRLVGAAFIENLYNKPQINHIDGNPLNNNVNNLEWVTAKENNIHARKNNLINTPKKRVKGVHNATKEVVEFESLTAAAKHFNVTKGAINAAIHNYGRSKYCKNYKWEYL